MSKKNFRCSQCGMVFNSEESVSKHKNRFCIGVLDSGINRDPIDSDSDDQSSFLTTQRQNQRTKPTIENFNQQRTNFQLFEQDKDRMFYDKQLDLIAKQDRTYREILREHEHLQLQQRELLREMYDLYPNGSATKITERLKTRLDDLQRRNRTLEQERIIIQEKLEELISNNYQPVSIYNHDPRRFLSKIKEQQEMNEKAVDFLRQRLVYPYNSLLDPDGIPPYPPNPVGKTTSDNVRDFRNVYMKSGGHNAAVLAQYTDMEYRLRAYEQYPWTTDGPEPLKPFRHSTQNTADPINEQLKLSNDENLRFQMELEEMQEKFDKLDQRTKQIEAALASNPLARSLDTQSMKTDFYPMSQFSNDIEPAERDQPTRQVHSTAESRLTTRESPPLTVLTSNSLRDPFAPRPYDPSHGFLIFFDFVLRLPRNIQSCRLVTGLHHPKSGLGSPSNLDSTKCKRYMDERTGEEMLTAIVAMKQPVPKCPPQQALTVVVKLQLSTKENPTNDEDFRTEAWTKFALFDQKNRLFSGRWKVPFKATPVLQDESLAIISTLPSFDNAELYYRLVNSQDGEDQSNVTLSPNNRDFYSYPTQYRK